MARTKPTARNANPPPRKQPAAMPTSGNAAASGSAPPSSQTSDEQSASSEAHHQATTSGPTETALEKARRERDLIRAAIQSLKDSQLVRQLTQSELNRLQSYHDARDNLINEIKRLKSSDDDENTTSNAAGKPGKLNEGKGGAVSVAKPTRQQNTTKGGGTAAEEGGNDLDDGVDSGDVVNDHEQPVRKANSGKKANPLNKAVSSGSSQKNGARQSKTPAAAIRVRKSQPMRKRKKGGHGWAKKKSHRPAWHPDNYNADPNIWYDIHDIIGETKTTYRIQWAGTDSAGGNYHDTSVPKANANRPAVLDWERREKIRVRKQLRDAKKSAEAVGAQGKGKK